MSGASEIIVSVIVVNYNGRHLLDACFRSLERQTLSRNSYEIVLIDNASIDGSVEFVRERFRSVRTLSMPRNLGFAAGNNIGFRIARGQYMAILNSDAEAHSDWLTRMIAAIEQSPSIGGVASKICFRHEPSRINSAGLLLYRDGRGGDRGYLELDVGQYETPMEVFAACGAAAMYRREMIAELGGFDERLFMYYEDLDLAWRARRRGWKFVYEPRAIVLHDHCGSSGNASPFFQFHVERNRVLVNLKNAPLGLAAKSIAGFGGRMLRSGWRLCLGRTTIAHAWALFRAGGSILLNLYAVFHQRLREPKSSDSPIDRLMSEPPLRAKPTTIPVRHAA
jgi:GT2 family glycosyltransferase